MTNQSSIVPEFEISNFHKSVYIIGLGWLGIPLARQLNSIGILTSGTVRSKSKQNQLKSIQLNADLLNLEDDFPNYYSAYGHLNTQPNRTTKQYVILNIPPGRSNFSAKIFSKYMTKLIDDLFVHNIERLIFISTTSVYGGLSGDVTLNSKIDPITDSAIAHVEIEQFLMNHFADKVLILRPAGLIGPNLDGSYRHPVFTLVKKQAISQGEDRVNLLHQSDLINCIQRAIELNLSNMALNLSSLEHPSRRDYYTWCAKELKLQPPNFCSSSKSNNSGKIIRSEESLMRLGDLKLNYPSPYDMLKH